MKVEAKAVQATLQSAFEAWGLPDAIRFDNGRPWGNPVHRVPTSLALWLVGLGIGVIYGRPRQSTDNAVVERSHGVFEGWVEPETCEDVIDLQQRLNYFADLQRTRYPRFEGHSRVEAYPQLLHPRRLYQREWDEAVWQQQRIYDYLAQFRWTRQVEKNGRITLLTHEYWVGRDFAQQKVTAWFDPHHIQWVLEDRHGEIVKRVAATQFTYLTIATLSFKYRKG